METDSVFEGVDVLWGFVDDAFLSYVQSSAAANGIPCYVPSEDILPQWTSQAVKRVFLLDFDYGEYEGPFGALRSKPAGWHPQPDEHKVRRYYEGKHPRWSASKIERSVKSRLKAVARGPQITHTLLQDQQARAYTEFFWEASAQSPLMFLLTDSAPSAVQAGGLDWHRLLKSVAIVEAGTLSEEQLVRFPAWTIVTVVHGSQSRQAAES